MRLHPRPGSVFLSIALLFALLLTATVNALEVTRTDRKEHGEVRYAVTSDDCNIVWTVRRFAHSTGFGLAEQSRCMRPLAEQAAFRTALLNVVKDENQQLDGLRNFYWGPLRRDDATTELANRLQRVAAKSTLWNTSKGRPAKASQGATRAVQSLLNKHRVFSEIADVFAAQGFNIEVNSVEKVIVGPGSDISMSNLQVPVDALVTLSVKRGNAKR